MQWASESASSWKRLPKGNGPASGWPYRGGVRGVSEAKRWLQGGYNHGHIANVPYPIAILVDAADLMPEALKMAEEAA